MRPTLVIALFATILLIPLEASAGLFGGFTKDGCVLRGDSQVCMPVTASKAGTCSTKSANELAKIKLSPGIKQVGKSGLVMAQTQGTKLVVLATENQAQVGLWDGQEVLGKVGDVYLHASKRWVAIEFQSRFAGRLVDDLVVLPISLPVASVAPKKSSVTTAKPVDSPEARKAIDEGKKLARKRRTHPHAQAAFLHALKLVPGHPEALFHLALLHVARKDTAATLQTLEKLAKSDHADMPRWRVEARFDVRFKSLRGDRRFRNAVGITRPAGDTPSLYERLVALGGRWEQETIPCEQPQVNLTLRRDAKQRFNLVIRSKCQGQSETTRLDGTWVAAAGKLALRFPNMDSDDDKLSCQIERCTDNSGEDCLRCQPEPDLEFLLRIVRR